MRAAKVVVLAAATVAVHAAIRRRLTSVPTVPTVRIRGATFPEGSAVDSDGEVHLVFTECHFQGGSI